VASLFEKIQLNFLKGNKDSLNLSIMGGLAAQFFLQFLSFSPLTFKTRSWMQKSKDGIHQTTYEPLTNINLPPRVHYCRREQTFLGFD
jgi:hypothetical protein